MGHNHNHHHHHRPKSTVTLILAICLTLGFAIIEVVGGYYANSLALISDAGHMLLDSLALVIAFIGAKIAQQAPTPKHSYGLGRAEVLTALISCVTMLVIAIIIATEAVHRFSIKPTHIDSIPVMIIASIGLCVNLIIAYILMKGQKTLNIRAALLHVAGDILGSIAALASGMVIFFTQWVQIDAILSLFIALLIGLSSVRMLKEIAHILMEGVPKHLNLNEIQQVLLEINDIEDVQDLHVWNVSSETVALSAHIKIKSLNNWETIYYTISSNLAEKFNIKHVTIQPDTPNISCQHCTINNSGGT
jgi:cobalt-zinc-cadmium efflux system protein